MKKLVHVNALASAIGVSLLGIGLSPATAGQLGVTPAAVSTAAEISSIGQYIVTFAEPGLLHYEGGASSGAQALAATSPRTLGTRKLDAQSPAAVAYSAYLDEQRAAHVSAIEAQLGRALVISHNYGVIRNGISVDLSPNELAAVAAVPGVVSVRAVKLRSPDTFRGPTFIGANTLWDGSNVPGGGAGVKGEGVKIGVIDMGANSAHPSFADDPACGFGPDNHKFTAFDCNTSSGGHCTGPDPEAPTGAGDVKSHGVHTASTAGGNTLDNTATPAPDLPDGVTMSGVAPCATVYSYRVSNASGSLPDSAISAAIEAIVTDGMDVANFSIGPTCGGGSPWNDDDRDFLDAIDADIFVAASAGNTRSNCTDPVGHVSHIGPWMTTVAASTQDQVLGDGQFKVTAPTPVPELIQNFGGASGSTTNMATVTDLTGVPFRTDPDNIAGCTASGGFPANYFDGAIAVVRRGATPPATEACTFTEKINNAQNAGALMVVIANNKNDAGGMDTTGATLPSFKVHDLATSDALIDFIGDNPSATVGDFVKTGAPAAVQGDVLGAFSFRGPTSGNFADLTKPDITGPGVSIYAAARAADNNYIVMGGTSMSSPHVAGSAALVRQAHPDWTPSEVKSALMTTSFQTGFQEDGITAWTPDQVGSGRVDLTKAALAGLTLDETYENYVAANPSGGTVDVKDLNIPSVRNVECESTCTWTRTVKNQLSTSASWNATATGNGFDLQVTPATFTLAPGETQELTITATLAGTLSQIAFGQVDLTETNGQSPDQHITAAVKGAGDAPPTTACNDGVCTLKIDTYEGSGSLSAVGVDVGTYFLWLNRFTPDPTDYPFTLNSVQTMFVDNLNGGIHGGVVGDTFDVYVYQDDDEDPTNGATLLASVTGVAVTAPLDQLQTIELPGGVPLDGPGDVIIALDYHGPGGHSPATADGGPDAGRSWLSMNFHSRGAVQPNGEDDDEIFADGFDGETAPTGPDLSQEGLVLASEAVSGFDKNWIIRGTGTKEDGRPVNLGSSKPGWSKN